MSESLGVAVLASGSGTNLQAIIDRLHVRVNVHVRVDAVIGSRPGIGALERAGYALRTFAESVDVITYEFENLPLASVEYLAGRMPVHPAPAALAAAQDRLAEKTLFRELRIDTPRFLAVASLDELTAAVAEIGLPAVLKTRRLGYDGKGQAVLRDPEDLERAWQRLGDAPLVLEAFVPFEEVFDGLRADRALVLSSLHIPYQLIDDGLSCAGGCPTPRSAPSISSAPPASCGSTSSRVGRVSLSAARGRRSTSCVTT